jgi:hypothetical protein
MVITVADDLYLSNGILLQLAIRLVQSNNELNVFF